MPSGALRKCFELSGVVPLAVFVAVHVAGYAGGLVGADDYGAFNPGGLLAFGLEALLVWLPLLFHAGVGARLAIAPLEREPAERRRSLGLRVTGALATPFVVLHALWFRLPLIRGERATEDVSEMLAARLSSTIGGVPIAALLHLSGLAVVSLHLAIGLPRFVEKWGLGSAVFARRAAAIGCGILFAVGAATVIDFATGSAIPHFLSK